MQPHSEAPYTSLGRASSALLDAADAPFHEHLYAWMQRTPWLGVSLAAHLLAYLVLASFPWEAFREEKPPILHARNEIPPPDAFEDPPEEPKELVPEETDVVDDVDVVDNLAEDTLTDDPVESTSDIDFAPNDFDTLGVIGLGGGPSTKYGPRIRGRRGRGDGRREAAVRSGLQWLAAHQSDDGSWDADGFQRRCGELGSTWTARSN